ncbi:GNAT family N-acetyltransferase [Carboxylicivirga linearis]|uniref:GNAT family N-acetyltransferase n=1 Tax=Carboxylicivirga linearis TaxID=1628157 RepID=A0ABS5JWD7_9BACT|nr:GNAT family N-acetyltransferase [Carboxylicivirga linearis]MBS2099227.1 GNAT family N-acetyltransferase [Carboxylicivirga linearis]
MEYKIRTIKISDYSNLIEMFKEFAAFQKMPDAMLNSTELMERESELINGFVIENKSGELLGYATCFYAYYTWIGKSMYMDDLYVKPKFRGKGLGQKLIQAVIQKAKEENCKKVHWQVSGWNTNAIEFYKKLGAKVDDVESNCDYLL